MQSSLLALLLASRFFDNPLISLACGISVIVMTLVSQVHKPAGPTNSTAIIFFKE